MSQIPENLKYSKEDEWIKVDGDVATIGITDYAQDQLSDIVYLELPSVGDSFEVGDVFGIVESVKAASDLFTPFACEIVEVNDALTDTPELINDDPYGDAWLIKVSVKNENDLNDLLDATAYTALIDERS